MDKTTHTEEIEMERTATIPTHIQARVDAALASGLLPASPTRAQILSTIGDARYLSAVTAKLGESPLAADVRWLEHVARIATHTEEAKMDSNRTTRQYPREVAREVQARRPDLASGDAIRTVLTVDPTLTAAEIIEILDEATADHTADRLADELA